MFRTIISRLFNDRKTLPKNKHIVKGLLHLCEALICNRLFRDNYPVGTLTVF